MALIQPGLQPSEPREEAIADLRALLPPGTTVYTILRYRSPVGTARVIQVLYLRTDPAGGREKPCYIGFKVASALGHKYDTEHEGVFSQSVVADIGFDIVHSLSHLLHGDGHALYQRWL
jgi:hypothetical protein